MPPSQGGESLEQLLADNHELRSMVSELQQLLEDAQGQHEQALAARQSEYESLLEEKSELIRSLHLKIQEMQARASAPPLPNEDELRSISEELERERSQLQQERRELEDLRRQLADDEKTMTQQMREMEVQMARERAELARQRIELQRIQDEIGNELERAARDSHLNERLSQLRQRYQDTLQRKGASPGGPPPANPGHAPDEPQNPASKDEPAKKKDSNLFRRFFG